MDNDVFLTIDLEWAHDEVLNDCIDIIEKAEVHATFFVTHRTPLLSRLRANHFFELGIHPNFNGLFDGTEPKKNAREILMQAMEIVPEAKSIRSHSLVQGSRLLDLFRECGLTHEANVFIPYTSGIPLRPWRHWNGLIRVPHFWEDDIFWHETQTGAAESLLATRGLKVLDFHPLSLYLNIEETKRYEQARPFLQKPEYLKPLINKGLGTRTFFDDILRCIKERKMQIRKLLDIQTEHLR